MELLLNVIWLVFSLSILASWGYCTYLDQGLLRKRALLVEALLLICVGLILFPVFSMSDDLVGDLWVPDDKASSALTARVDSPHNSGHSLSHLWACLVAICAAGLSALIGDEVATYFPEVTGRFSLAVPTLCLSRAPPSISHHRH